MTKSCAQTVLLPHISEGIFLNAKGTLPAYVNLRSELFFCRAIGTILAQILAVFHHFWAIRVNACSRILSVGSKAGVLRYTEDGFML